MLRVDRIIGQARLLRVRRAARCKIARGELEPVGFFGTPEEVSEERRIAHHLIDQLRHEPVSVSDPLADDEGLLSEVEEAQLGDGDQEATSEAVGAPEETEGHSPETVVDGELMDALVAEVFVGIVEMIDKMQIREKLAKSVSDRFFRRVGMSDPEVAKTVNSNRARVAALRDLTTLMVEDVLDQAIAGINEFHDRQREVPLHPYAGKSLVLEKGRVKRLGRSPKDIARLEKRAARRRQVSEEAEPVAADEPAMLQASAAD